MRINASSNLRSYTSVFVVALALCACAGASKTNTAEPANATSVANKSSNTSVSGSGSQSDQGQASIPIEQGGPADTVRAFYRLLRDKRFREAIFLTNLRPAIEGLTDTELKEFAVDFEALAGQVPVNIEINGEIITGDQATVTANLPTEDGDKKVQPVKLHRDNGVWSIQTVDDATAARIRKEGKQYFYSLRIETHEEEAKKMLDRISRAQMVYSLQNGGTFADVEALIVAGYLPEDVRTSESTGYNYKIDLVKDRKNYTATAAPAEYGKSGKLTFTLTRDKNGQSHVASKDNGGK